MRAHGGLRTSGTARPLRACRVDRQERELGPDQLVRRKPVPHTAERDGAPRAATLPLRIGRVALPARPPTGPGAPPATWTSWPSNPPPECTRPSRGPPESTSLDHVCPSFRPQLADGAVAFHLALQSSGRPARRASSSPSRSIPEAISFSIIAGRRPEGRPLRLVLHGGHHRLRRQPPRHDLRRHRRRWRSSS